ncbi:hypothetical protein PAMP_020552 [Pampus punctatissimus]
MQSCEPLSICLTVAMVTTTTPWRQQWEVNWDGGEGKAALRDEKKMMEGDNYNLGQEGRGGGGSCSSALKLLLEQQWMQGELVCATKKAL